MTIENFNIPSDIDEIIKFLDKEYQKFEGKTILLTGGRGFLGRYFTEIFLKINKLNKKPCKILSIDNLITSGILGDQLPKNKNDSNNVKIGIVVVNKPLVELSI